MTEMMTKRPKKLAFDPDALRRKYREERDKRLDPRGKGQYIELAGDYAAYADDPHADPDFTRDPVCDEVDVVILGGGITGLMAAAHMRKAGIDRVRIIEKAADFGGTWYWNRYPGIRCDVESYIYLPMLEEMNYIPREKYSRGSEIFAHCQAIGRHFNLYDEALFQTQVQSMTWDEESARWVIRTDRGDAVKAKFIAIGTGPISKPKLPGIPGIRDFKGHTFHTARWDYAYTGGSPDGDLTGLADKRVAIIGTGATGIQVIPHVGRSAKETLVIQRTPSAVDVRDNRPTDPEWVKTLKPGWQQERVENFSAILNGMKVEQDLVADRWTDVWGKLTKWANTDPEFAANTDPADLLQLADFEKMEEIRKRIEDTITDPETAGKLKPWYDLFCKRPNYSDDYLDTFNLPSVKLIDTDGHGVERITETGIVINGTEYAIDCIIFASGYDIGTPTYKAGNYQIIGRNGTSLADKWGRGLRTIHGMLTDEFPNMFTLGTITQAAASVNFPHILGFQARHSAALIKRCIDKGVRTFEVTPEAVQGWQDTLIANAVDRTEFERECTPSYLNNEGKSDEGPSLFGGTYGGGIFDYIRICDEWRESGIERDVKLSFEKASEQPGMADDSGSDLGHVQPIL